MTLNQKSFEPRFLPYTLKNNIKQKRFRGKEFIFTPTKANKILFH